MFWTSRARKHGGFAARHNRKCRRERLENRLLLAADLFGDVRAEAELLAAEGEQPAVVNVTDSVTVRRSNANIVVSDSTSTLLDIPIGMPVQLLGDQAANTFTLDFTDGNFIPASGLQADGAGGSDAVVIVGAIDLDLRGVGPVSLNSLEKLDATDPAAQNVTLDAAAIRSWSTQGKIEYRGGNEDELIFADASQWRMTAPVTINGEFTETAVHQGSGERVEAITDSPFRNLVAATDVNNDGAVQASDAINVINELTNRRVSDAVSGEVFAPATVNAFPNFYPDTSGDNIVSALDALQVINEIARRSSPPPTNIAITTDPGVQQNPSVAVNPSDPDHVVVAYVDYSLLDTGYAGIGVAVSRDGGVSFTNAAVPLPEMFDEGAAVPVARFDDQGNVFVSYMAATFLRDKPPITNPNFFNPERGASDREFGLRANNGVFLVRSDDGGTTWNDPVAIVSHLYDQVNDVPFDVIPDIAVDTFENLPDGQPNPNYRNMYATWTRLYAPGDFPGEPTAAGGTDVFVAVSSDNGATWQTKQEMRDGVERTVIQMFADDFNTGIPAPPGLGFIDQPHLAVGSGGEVYLSTISDGDFTIHVSTDGGDSFLEPDEANGQGIVFGRTFSTFANPEGIPNNGFRTHTVRAVAADPVRPGTVYAVEPIQVVDALGGQIDAADVYFARSDNLGTSFETTLTVGPHPDLSDVRCASGVGLDCVSDGFRVPLNDDNHALTAVQRYPVTEVRMSSILPRRVGWK